MCAKAGLPAEGAGQVHVAASVHHCLTMCWGVGRLHRLRDPLGEQRRTRRLRLRLLRCRRNQCDAENDHARQCGNRSTGHGPTIQMSQTPLMGYVRRGLAADIDLDADAIGVLHEDLLQIDLGSSRSAIVESTFVEQCAQTSEIIALKRNVVERTATCEPIIGLDEVQMHYGHIAEKEPCSRKSEVWPLIGAILEPQDVLVERNRVVGLARIDVDVIKSVDSHLMIVDHYSAATH